MTHRYEPYTLALTITASDEDKDGIYVVSDDHGTVFGSASNPYSAVQDYFRAKYDHMRDLQENSHRLAPGLRVEFARLCDWAEGRV